jgi:hypothetical protein
MATFLTSRLANGGRQGVSLSKPRDNVLKVPVSGKLAALTPSMREFRVVPT